MVTAIQWRLENCASQALANISWAFATAGQKDELLFAALVTTTEWRTGHFNLQDLANIAWAFALASQTEERLLAALAMLAEQCSVRRVPGGPQFGGLD